MSPCDCEIGNLQIPPWIWQILSHERRSLELGLPSLTNLVETSEGCLMRANLIFLACLCRLFFPSQQLKNFWDFLCIKIKFLFSYVLSGIFIALLNAFTRNYGLKNERFRDLIRFKMRKVLILDLAFNV